MPLHSSPHPSPTQRPSLLWTLRYKLKNEGQQDQKYNTHTVSHWLLINGMVVSVARGKSQFLHCKLTSHK